MAHVDVMEARAGAGGRLCAWTANMLCGNPVAGAGMAHRVSATGCKDTAKRMRAPEILDGAMSATRLNHCKSIVLYAMALQVIERRSPCYAPGRYVDAAQLFGPGDSLHDSNA